MLFEEYLNEVDQKIENAVEKGTMVPLKTTDLGENYRLPPKVFNKYIRDATINRTILDDARQIITDTEKMYFHHIGFDKGMLEPGTEYVEPGSRTPKFARTELNVKEFITRVGVTDQTLRRDLERKQLVNTILSMAANQVGLDWEALSLCGDTQRFNPTGPTNFQKLLKSTDGWVKKSTNKIYAHDSSGNVISTMWNPGNEDEVTLKMKRMLEAFVKKNITVDRSRLCYYLNTKDYNNYIEYGPGARPTGTGDSALWGNVAQKFRGIQVKEADILNDADCTNTTTGWGKFSVLTVPSNLVYAVLHNVTVEPERHPSLRSTDWVFTMEFGQELERPEAMVVAFDDLNTPTSAEVKEEAKAKAKAKSKAKSKSESKE